MARFMRMRGRPTLWLPGTDHAGIATQVHHTTCLPPTVQHDDFLHALIVGAQIPNG